MSKQTIHIGDSKKFHDDINANFSELYTSTDTLIQLQGQDNPVLTTGTAPDFLLTPLIPIIAYSDNMRFTVQTHADSGTNPTLKINDLTAINILIRIGKAATWEAGQVLTLVYLSGNFFTVNATSTSGGIDDVGVEEVVKASSNIVKNDVVLRYGSVGSLTAAPIIPSALPATSIYRLEFITVGEILYRGYTSNVAPFSAFHKWVNNTWVALPTLSLTTTTTSLSMCIFQGMLHVAFGGGKGTAGIAYCHKWDGNAWSATLFSSTAYSFGSTSCEISEITSLGSTLIFIVSYRSSSSPIYNLTWDGTTLTYLSSITNAYPYGVASKLFNGTLFMAIGKNNGNPDIMMWNGTTWIVQTISVAGTPNYYPNFEIHNNKLYVVFPYTVSTTTSAFVYEWNGVSWVSKGTLTANYTTSNTYNAILISYNSILYAFATTASSPFVVGWYNSTGTTWVQLASPSILPLSYSTGGFSGSLRGYELLVGYGMNTSYYMMEYIMTTENLHVPVAVASGMALTNTYTGIAKEDIPANSTGKVQKIRS